MKSYYELEILGIEMNRTQYQLAGIFETGGGNTHLKFNVGGEGEGLPLRALRQSVVPACLWGLLEGLWSQPITCSVTAQGPFFPVFREISGGDT